MSEQHEGAGQRIVVGVDGSPSSMAALRWAVRQAELTGGSVEAVTAWHSPPMLGIAAPYSEADISSGDAGVRAAAEEMLRKAVADAAGPTASVSVTAQIGEGSAIQLLLAAAEGAAMVVVGSRGHGGFAGAMLGSVGQALSQHSPCPVLIFRGVE